MFFSSLTLFSATSLTLPESADSLLRFLHSLPISSQHLLPWDQSDPATVCNWQGVTCHQKSSSLYGVQSLNLSGLGLAGELSSSVSHLCNLSGLLYMDLSLNNFTGGIPKQLGNCGKVESLLLNYNGFHGLIPPDIFRSKLLVKLDLGNNMLTGEIPHEVGLCSKLEYIGVYNNFLTGLIPVEMFSLPRLEFVYLNTNNFTGDLAHFADSCAISELWIHEKSFSGILPKALGNCHNMTSFIASSNNLGGFIQPEIFENMLNLEIMYLDGNHFIGEIPETLWGLGGLQELVLSNNQFNGSISDLVSNCSQLSVLALSENSFTGQIPRSIGGLKYLVNLYLFDNMLGGSIPPELGNCSSLTELRLQNNFFTGEILPEICNFENLEVLHLYNNRLSGKIPEQVGTMISLYSLALYNNSLSGRIPTGVTHLKKLTFLSLTHNHLSGEVPNELGTSSLPNLQKLDLSSNHLSGLIPSDICTVGGKISGLALGNNIFNGTFPSQIANCASLIRVILSNNSLHGEIPMDLAENNGVSFLDVQGNSLIGKIPSVLGLWRNLSMLDLSDNLLSGNIPPEFGKLENLQILRISNNRLTGRLPTELGRCSKTIELDLSKNNLTGSIPVEVISLEQMQRLLLHDNRFSGTITDLFSAHESLFEIQLGNNLLEGSIPCSLSLLHHFSSSLNLSCNRLTGEIPSCLGNLDKLQTLDLSSNYLSGEIPSQLNNMASLSFVNISFNHLTGKVPDLWKKLLILHPESFVGNSELCITRRDSICQGVRHAHSRGWEIAVIVVGVVTSVILFSVLILILVRRRIPDDSSISQRHLFQQYQSMTEDLPENLKFEDIMRATEGWSEKYIIGKGKHGTVYRTELLHSKKNWAVKKLDLSLTGFELEIRTMSLVRHRNVVKMEGHCIKDGYGFIITEYVPGGTLFDVLHRNRSALELSWEIRLRIALGLAHGPSYLHHDCVPQIIHRDVKSDNVLMDADLEPKIGDFGLARIYSGESDASSVESAIVGTLGYIAPENAYSTTLTEKCDVYGYGVILMELLCRTLPVDPCFEEGQDIVSWARMKLQENNETVCFLDQEICSWDIHEQEKVLKLLDVAFECTSYVPDDRPSMRNVVTQLEKL